MRRRLARVFSICVSQRAVDALLLALDDQRFEVRFQCGRSLSAIVAKNALVRIDRERIFEVVRREVTVSRPVWQSHRLLDAIADEKASFVDDFIKDRAGQSLAHVFVLLVAGPAGHAAADRLSRAAHDRPGAARHRARVS